MADVIDFLEQLGKDAQLRHATRTEIERNSQDANISSDVRAAIATGDQRRLESLLGADSNVCCIVYMPQVAPEESSLKRVAIAR